MNANPVATETEETRYGAVDLKIMVRFFGYARPYGRWLLVALLLLPLGALVQLAQPLMIKQAVDNHLMPGTLDGFGWVLAAWLGLILAQLALGYLQTLVNALLGQRVIRDLRSHLFAHLSGLEAAFFARWASGRLTNRLTNDTEVVSQMVSAGLLNLAGDLLLLIGIGLGMIHLSPPLSLVALLAMPVIVAGTLLVARIFRRLHRRARLLLAGMASLLTEEIDGHQVVRLFRRQAHNDALFDRSNRDYLETSKQANFWEAFQYSFVEAVSTLTVGVLFWYGGWLREAGDGASIGTLVAFIDYLRRIFFPIRDLSSKFTTLQASMTALERIFHLLDRPPTLTDPPAATIALPDPVRGAITCQGVQFDYGQEPILQGIDLDIRPGEKVAIAGPTGAGKSTLIKLLNRSHDPTHGRVLLDGVDLREIPLARLRRLVGVVQQETFLFAGTVADNIGLGDPAITPDVIRAAAGEVGALDFIDRLPQGIYTPLAERGVNLSAGQRQLLGLARVLAFDPRILVMDEATSSVDTISERHIQAAMKRLLQQRTALIVAHRLSTILDADRIVVLAGGRVIEQGTHGELLAHDGLYARLYALQFRQLTDPASGPAVV
ncbi:MAG: ABC transporter ATP-binding protein [Magnetococcales bacterium]|nr:ABC transporter ATP-binding protein [Magnetococcales bacterium]